MKTAALVQLLTKPKRAILTALADGRERDVRSLAIEVRSSRQAVHKQMQQLVAAGVVRVADEPQGPNAPRRFYSLVREGEE